MASGEFTGMYRTSLTQESKCIASIGRGGVVAWIATKYIEHIEFGDETG